MEQMCYNLPAYNLPVSLVFDDDRNLELRPWLANVVEAVVEDLAGRNEVEAVIGVLSEVGVKAKVTEVWFICCVVAVQTHRVKIVHDLDCGDAESDECDAQAHLPGRQFVAASVVHQGDSGRGDDEDVESRPPTEAFEYVLYTGQNTSVVYKPVRGQAACSRALTLTTPSLNRNWMRTYTPINTKNMQDACVRKWMARKISRRSRRKNLWTYSQPSPYSRTRSSSRNA